MAQEQKSNEPKDIERDPDWSHWPANVAYRRLPITEEQAKAIINGDRSQWYLVRGMDGALMLACYPHDESYTDTEAYRGTF